VGLEGELALVGAEFHRLQAERAEAAGVQVRGYIRVRGMWGYIRVRGMSEGWRETAA
jgi:hypothetical protein